MPSPRVCATLVLLAALAAPPALAQSDQQGFQKCGDPNLTLVFMNPDLKVQSDGYVHASGSFFIQFQARGETAFDIESLKFSFGKEAGGVSNCATPEWISEGMFLKNFRADYDPRDGFFIPINTCNVPNGDYIAGLSAYDKDLKELVRYWTKARVDNGPGTTKAERCANPDKTAPWPIILPGDGERTDGMAGLYIEIAEPVTEVIAWINGVRVPLTEGQGPERDDDLVVDLGYHPAIRDAGVAQGHAEKRRYPLYEWSGDVLEGDVVKVRAVDVGGNIAEKIVHVGDPTIGGRATLAAPDFELRIPETDKVADATGVAIYNVTYVTKSSEGLHADLYVRNESGGTELPGGITYRLRPNHVMMGGNEDLKGTIELIARPETPLGTYKIQFAANYLAGVAREEKVVPLTFRVDTSPETDASQDEFAVDGNAIPQEQVRDGSLDGEEVNTTATEDEKKTPVPALAPLVALAALALARRRR